MAFNDKAQRLLGEGMERLAAGQLSVAEKRFRGVLKAAPGHPLATHYLGLCLFHSGRAAEGVRQMRLSVKAESEQVDFRTNLGEALRQMGDAKGAVEHLEKGYELDPSNAALGANLGLALLDVGEIGRGLDLLRASVHKEPGNLRFRLNLASGLRTGGELNEALALFGELWAQALGEPELAREYGLSLHADGQLDLACEVYRAGLARASDDAILLNNLANAERALGRVEEAAALLRKAAGQPGVGADVIANAAACLEAMNQEGEAWNLVRRAIKQAPDHPLALAVRGVIERRRGEITKSVADLQKALASGLPDTFRAWSYQNLGRVLEKDGQFGSAYEAYASMNDVNRESAHKAELDLSITDHWMASSRWLLEHWEVPLEIVDAQASPVFMVGFPRSGTTLLEQMLASHSQVEATEEQGMVIGVRGEVSASLEADVWGQVLLDKDSDALFQVREAYRGLAREYLGANELPPVFADKYPLNILHAPFIARLFPKAKWIYSYRDPRDVCLSCFVQSFQLNPAMARFHSMPSTVKFYEQVLNLWEDFVSLVQPDVRDVRYETLVDAPEEELRGICDFLELNWEPAMLDYRKRARGKVVTTTSYDQVIKPLYRDAMGRWRGFAEPMQSVLPQLAPWVARYGYEPE